jgi:hypothetical protein
VRRAVVAMAVFNPLLMVLIAFGLFKVVWKLKILVR